MNHEQEKDEKTLGLIKESLDYLDRGVEVKKPDVLRLFDLVNEVQERKTVANNRQFLIFLVVALVSICLETYLFSRSIAIFACIQAIALLCVIPSILVYRKNRQVSR